MPTNPFATNVNWVVSSYDGTRAANSCVLFAYDSDGNDAVDNVDRRGYRLVTTGSQQSVEMRRTGTGLQRRRLGGHHRRKHRLKVLNLDFTTTTEPGMSGVEVRTVIVTLRAATHTRSADPANLTAADCTNIDVVCRQLVEKIRVRNDAVL